MDVALWEEPEKCEKMGRRVWYYYYHKGEMPFSLAADVGMGDILHHQPMEVFDAPFLRGLSGGGSDCSFWKTCSRLFSLRRLGEEMVDEMPY